MERQAVEQCVELTGLRCLDNFLKGNEIRVEEAQFPIDRSLPLRVTLGVPDVGCDNPHAHASSPRVIPASQQLV